MSEQEIKRKMRKLARRCAEANIWADAAKTKTFCSCGDVWHEAFQLIKLAGLLPEYEKREKQLRRARGD